MLIRFQKDIMFLKKLNMNTIKNYLIEKLMKEQ